MGNRCRGCFSWGFKSLSGDSRKIQCHGGGRLRYALQHTIYRLDDQPNLLLGDEPNHHTKGIWSEEYGRSPKGLLYAGIMKILVPLIIVVPGIVAFYYFGEQFYDNQDFIYPELVKKVMPLSLVGFFAAVILGAILSTFNSVLNSAATIFSL